MPVKILEGEGNIFVARISGRLTQPDFAALQQATAKFISERGAIKVLAIIENFLGWDNSGDWGDCSFQVENDSYIKKMAIVGDPKWKEEAFMFTGQGFRPVQIEFFEPSQAPAASHWLDTL